MKCGIAEVAGRGLGRRGGVRLLAPFTSGNDGKGREYVFSRTLLHWKSHYLDIGLIPV